MDYLAGKGMNIMVLPEGQRAEELCYGLLAAPKQHLNLSKRFPHEHPHYQPRTKTVVLPSWSLTDAYHNVALHEIGHATDFLFLGDGRAISDIEHVVRALKKVPPLDSHCKEQDNHYKNSREQFATSFEAFFNEKFTSTGSKYYHTIDELDESFIRIVNRNFIDPFSK